MKIKLTHTSYLEGAEGVTGQVIDVSDEIAQRFLSDGGAVASDHEEKPKTGGLKKSSVRTKADSSADD